MDNPTTQPVDGPKDFGTDQRGIAARWITEIQMAEKELDIWQKQARKIVARYRDERSAAASSEHRFNVLWSNVQTLLPAVYARPPQPVVARRFRDSDPVGRAASQILQRCLQQEIDATELHQTMRQCVLDYLLVGRGTCWERYEPHFDTPGRPGDAAPDSESDSITPADAGVQVENDGSLADEELAWETSQTDYVHWEDFLHSPARTWDEVRWVARKVLMTRAELRSRFGKAIADDVPLDWKPRNLPDQGDDPKNEIFKRARVYEIWSADDRTVYWVAPSHGDRPLDQRHDPLELEGFFPCPKPLFGTTTNSTLIPLPDYVEYQDQANGLDELTDRITRITRAIKVAGVYDASQSGVARIFNEGVENQLIPVDTWGSFAQKGGLEGTMDLLPIKEMGEVLQALVAVRSQVKSDLYEITGIADIIRGASAPEETATAQRIKGRYATMRLSDRQTEVARFVRDVLRLKAEVMCRHFAPETLLLASDWRESELAIDGATPASPPGQTQTPPLAGAYGPSASPQRLALAGGQPPGAPQPGPAAPGGAPGPGAPGPGAPGPVAPGAPQPQPGPGGIATPGQNAAPQQAPQGMPPATFQAAVALLKDNRLRGFRVDVEDQSTIATDDEAEKAQRIEFLEAVGKFIGTAIEIPPSMAPALAPLMGKLLLFGIRGFRAGLELETAFEDAVAKLEAATNQPPAPDPKLLLAQAQAQKAQAEAQGAGLDAHIKQQELGVKQQELAQSAQQAAAQNQQDAQQHQIDVARLQMDQQAQQHEQIKAGRDHQLALMKLQLEQQKLEFEHRKLAVDAAHVTSTHEQGMRKADIAEKAALSRPDGSPS